MKLGKWLSIIGLCISLSAVNCSALHAQNIGGSAEVSAPRNAVAPLPYKLESDVGIGALVIRVVGGLLLVTGLAFGITLMAKRFMPSVRGYSMDGKNRIQLLESRRLTPRLTLFAVEFDGKTVLLAQCGDNVIDLNVQGRERSNGTDLPSSD